MVRRTRRQLSNYDNLLQTTTQDISSDTEHAMRVLGFEAVPESGPGPTLASALLDAGAVEAMDEALHVGTPAKQFQSFRARDIELAGPYVRTSYVESTLRAIRESLDAGRDIEQPIGVRRDAADPNRLILVYGRHRLKVAVERDLIIPVRVYGPMADADALALQFLENGARADEHLAEVAHGVFLLHRELQARKDRLTQEPLRDESLQDTLLRRPAGVMLLLRAMLSIKQARGTAEASLTPEQLDEALQDDRVRRKSALYQLTGLGEAVQALAEEERETLLGFPMAPKDMLWVYEAGTNLTARLSALRSWVESGGMPPERKRPPRPPRVRAPKSQSAIAHGVARVKVPEVGLGVVFEGGWTQEDLQKNPDLVMHQLRNFADELRTLLRQQTQEVEQAEQPKG
jgi:ParB-like chromosome segregation protein Spo0J